MPCRCSFETLRAAPPNRITRSRHSSLIDRTNRSACALQFGARNGVRMIRTPSCSRNSSTPTAPLPIAIADQYASVRQDAINRIRQVAHGLSDEGFIRVRGAGHMDAPRRQLENEQGVLRHRSARGPDLRRERVCRHEGRPMRAEKRAPGGRPLATGWDTFRFQDGCDR